MPDVIICSDAFPDSSLIGEEGICYGTGPTYVPVRVDSTHLANQAAVQASSNTFGAFAYGDSLIYVLRASAGVRVFKSTDAGATWSLLDSAGEPGLSKGSAYFDEDNDRLVFALVSSNSSGLHPINLIAFDLLTETWGSSFAGSGPNARTIGTVWKRLDGSIVVLYANRTGFSSGDPSGLAFSDYSGSWGTELDVGAGITALTGWDETQTIVNTTSNSLNSCMEPDGTLHVFFVTSSLQTSPVIWGNRCFYQQIAPDNSFGSFYDFPGQDVAVAGAQDMRAFSGGPFGRPALLIGQDKIILPVIMTNRDTAPDDEPNERAHLFIGEPISAPVWTVDTSVSIDPDVFVDQTIWPQTWGGIAFDGETIYIVFSAQGADVSTNFARIRLCKTINLSSPDQDWQASTPYDVLTSPDPGGFLFSGQSLISPSVSVPTAQPGNDFRAGSSLISQGRA